MIDNSELSREIWEKGYSLDCPVIDMHGHMGPYNGIWFPYAPASDMIHTMDRAGVQLLCFSHHYALFSPDIGNTFTINAVKEYPNRLRGYLVINPNYPEIINHNIQNFNNYKDIFIGFKLFADYHMKPIDDPSYSQVWSFANSNNMLILCHTWGGSPNDGEIIINKMSGLYPDVKLILAHSIHGAWEESIKIALKSPNIYLDLTAVLDDCGVVEKFIQSGLSERILFGTDLPWFHPHQGIGSLLSAHISDEDRHNILHRNAEKLLNSVGVALNL